MWCITLTQYKVMHGQVMQEVIRKIFSLPSKPVLKLNSSDSTLTVIDSLLYKTGILSLLSLPSKLVLIIYLFEQYLTSIAALCPFLLRIICACMHSCVNACEHNNVNGCLCAYVYVCFIILRINNYVS